VTVAKQAVGQRDRGIPRALPFDLIGLAHLKRESALLSTQGAPELTPCFESPLEERELDRIVRGARSHPLVALSLEVIAVLARQGSQPRGRAMIEGIPARPLFTGLTFGAGTLLGVPAITLGCIRGSHG
jgi:hypothetical protein